MTVLVSDSFNRADSTTTLGTTDSYNGGTNTAWQTIAGTAAIVSNQAALSSNGIAVLDGGASDNVTLNVTVSVVSSEEDIYFRFVDANNYLRVARAASTLYLQKKVNGTSTTIASVGYSAVNGNIFSISLQGIQITVNVNGVTKITGSDSNFTTATKYGLGIFSSNNSRFDNFEVDSLGTGGTGTTVTSVIADSTADALNPVISTDNTITSIVADAVADGLAPQVGSFTNVTVNSILANSTADMLNPGITTIQNISVVSPVSDAVADALVPSITVPMSTQITVVLASVIADALYPVISLNQSIWKSENQPITNWNIPNTPVLKDIWR